MNNKTNFNDWVRNTQFGSMWVPTESEQEFYEDHEYRKVLYQEVKNQPKIDFEQKPFMEILAESLVKILKLKQE
jgi:hypothetical protein